MTLLTEFAAAAGALHRATGCVEWLSRQGIAAEVTFGPHACIAGVARIRTEGNCYEPDPDGQQAIIVPVSLSYETCELDPYDLVAWHPAEPGRWFARRGAADILNPEAIERSVSMDEPLQVRETPLAWLQGGMTGIVVLDWTAHLPLLLPPKLEICCATPELGHRLLNQLRKHRDALPLVKVPEARDAV